MFASSGFVYLPNERIEFFIADIIQTPNENPQYNAPRGRLK